MNDKREKLAAEIEAALPHFTGTEEYHRIRYPWLRKDFLLTDGAKYLADKAGLIGGTAYWLIDIIASHQLNHKVASEGFQTWKLYVNHDQVENVEPDPSKALLVGAIHQQPHKLPAVKQAEFDPEEPERPLPATVLAWKQRARPNEAQVTCDDGNNHLRVTQEIPFADFALDEVCLYVTNDDFNGIVVMLLSEY
jgi:hypothetical protein